MNRQIESMTEQNVSKSKTKNNPVVGITQNQIILLVNRLQLYKHNN